MRVSAKRTVFASVLLVALSSRAPVERAYGQDRPPHPDPAFGFLVEGRVLLADGRPAAGAVVERAPAIDFDADRRTTDAEGRFRFEDHGLGWGPGLVWQLTIRRQGCPDVVRSVSLRAGPIEGRPRDEATGVAIRLPPCAADPPAPAPPRRSPGSSP